MKPTVTIVKLNTGWMFSIVTYNQDGIACIKRFTFDKLAEAIDAANALRMHVDNANVLPINQYKKGA